MKLKSDSTNKLSGRWYVVGWIDAHGVCHRYRSQKYSAAQRVYDHQTNHTSILCKVWADADEWTILTSRKGLR